MPRGSIPPALPCTRSGPLGRLLAFLHVLWLLPCLLLAGAGPARAADAASVHGDWNLRANNWPGTLTLNQAADGSISGTMYGEPVRGYYAAAQRTLALLRGQPGSEIQAFWGTVDADGQGVRGEFHGLNGSSSGASTALNRFAWTALRNGPVPATPAQGFNPGVAGPQSVAGAHPLHTSAQGPLATPAADLVLAPRPDGTLGGTLDRVLLRGFYADGDGRLVFVRGAPMAPEALHVGTLDLLRPPTLPNLHGAVYPLSAAAAAQMAAVPGSWGASVRPLSSLGGRWNLNGNGWPGELVLTQAQDGSLGGWMYGERVVGYHAPGERTAVLLRGPEGLPTQAFIGQLSADGLTWSGVFHALSAAAGASPGGNRFAFAARRAPLPAPTVAVGSAPGAGPWCVHQAYTLASGPTVPAASALPRVWFGSAAALCPGDTVFGRSGGQGVVAHISSSVAVWLRMDGTVPSQLYVGVSDASATEWIQGQQVVGRMHGKLYLLTPAAGAQPVRMSHDFGATLCLACPP